MLAAYFVIPFLDMYRSIEVKINGSLSGGNGHMIQQLGAFWGQYFAFTEKIDGYSVEEANVRFALTPGPVLMITLIAIVNIFCILSHLPIVYMMSLYHIVISLSKN